MGKTTHDDTGDSPGSGRIARTRSALVVEDQTILRDMLVEALSMDPRFAAVVAAGTAEEAVARLGRSTFDLVVLDMMLPDGHGLEVLADVRRRTPRARVLVLTAHPNPDVVHAALREGAHGIVMKGAPLHELRTAVDRVMGGGVYHCATTSELVHELVRTPAGKEPLSARQRQILRRVAAGASTKQIAAELGLSEKTVSNHRSAIMQRLGIHDVAGLTRYAIGKGIVEP
ncbi:MAG: response regulator transcription factor [Polyangiaceae bacterium]|nr:response regulator transcription factor [Polyangiaceae bacterium]